MTLVGRELPVSSLLALGSRRAGLGQVGWRSRSFRLANAGQLAGLTRVARDKALPFEPLIPNETTIAAMREARAGNLARFDSIEGLLTELHADD